MRPKNTTSLKDLKAERKRLETTIETFLLQTKLDGKKLTREAWCLKAGLDKCLISVVLTDKTFTRRIGKKAAISLANAVSWRKVKLTRADLRPDLFGDKNV